LAELVVELLAELAVVPLVDVVLVADVLVPVVTGFEVLTGVTMKINPANQRIVKKTKNLNHFK
jgi:hypothetical protein